MHFSSLLAHFSATRDEFQTNKMRARMEAQTTQRVTVFGVVISAMIISWAATCVAEGFVRAVGAIEDLKDQREKRRLNTPRAI
jgi:hypothetical protein